MDSWFPGVRDKGEGEGGWERMLQEVDVSTQVIAKHEGSFNITTVLGAWLYLHVLISWLYSYTYMYISILTYLYTYTYMNIDM